MISKLFLRKLSLNLALIAQIFIIQKINAQSVTWQSPQLLANISLLCWDSQHWLTAQYNGSSYVYGNASAAGPWETFSVYKIGTFFPNNTSPWVLHAGDVIAIQTIPQYDSPYSVHYPYYFSMDLNNLDWSFPSNPPFLMANAQQIGSWEQFVIWNAGTDTDNPFIYDPPTSNVIGNGQQVCLEALSNHASASGVTPGSNAIYTFNYTPFMSAAYGGNNVVHVGYPPLRFTNDQYDTVPQQWETFTIFFR